MPRFTKKQIEERFIKHRQEVESACEKFYVDKPQSIYECAFVHWNLVNGAYKKETGTIEVLSTHEDTAREVARDKLYSLLTAQAGTIDVISSRLIGKLD